MESISAIEAEKAIRESGLRIMTVTDVGRLLKIEKKNTENKLVQRLEKYGLLIRVVRGVYRIRGVDISDFEIANFLCTSSYISLESALTYYGILSQFTYSITSITTGKSRKLVSGGKEFEYTKMTKDLFWGYEKKDGALIAYPEKAFLDMVYLTAKGLRKLNMEELDMSGMDKRKLREFAERYSYAPFNKYIAGLNLW